jgi:hypothetical protein
MWYQLLKRDHVFTCAAAENYAAAPNSYRWTGAKGNLFQMHDEVYQAAARKCAK